MKCGWALPWTLYYKRDTHLNRFNKYLDEDIATLPIHPNEDLTVFYSINILIQKNIDLSKAIIYTNIQTKRYLKFLMSFTDISYFLDEK